MNRNQNKIPKLSWSEKDILGQKALQQELWNLIEKDTGNPLLVDWAAKLIKKLNVPERDELALAKAVQKYSQDHIKFFREYPERFTSPLRTAVWGIGDCDDKARFISSILRTFRIPIRLKFIRFEITKNGITKKVSHVYPQAKINNEWISLESVHKWPIGLDPENLAKRKGIIPKVDYIGDA